MRKYRRREPQPLPAPSKPIAVSVPEELAPESVLLDHDLDVEALPPQVRVENMDEVGLRQFAVQYCGRQLPQDVPESVLREQVRQMIVTRQYMGANRY